MPTWAGVVIGVGIGALTVALMALFLLDDDDDQAVTTDSTTPATAAPTSGTSTTTDDPDEPGGLDPVAVDAAESISETFDASAAEQECMLDAFEENPELFAALDEDELTDPDLMVEVIGVAKDCLDPDELAATFTEGMLEGSDVELTPEQAGCLGDELLADDDLLAVLLVLGADPDATPTADQIGPLFELFATCDLASVIAESIQADDPTITDEQALCISEGMLELQPELIEELVGGMADPSPEMLDALLGLFSACDLDLGAGLPDVTTGPT